MNTPLSAGLLLARVYAICGHKSVILALLGVLGCCAILPIMVCFMSCCERARRSLQVQVGFNTCNATESELGTARKWVVLPDIATRHIELIITIITNSLDVSLLTTSILMYWFTHISDHYQYHRYRDVRHNGGCCDTGENAGHLETLQTINMAR